MELNQQQILSGTRTALTVVGTLAAAVGVIHPDVVPVAVDLVLAVVGPSVILFNFVYGMWNHSHQRAIQHAVAAVQANPTLNTVLPLAGALREAQATVDLRQVPAVKPKEV